VPLLLAVVVSAHTAHAQPSVAAFLAALGELRDASYADKEAIADRLVVTGYPTAGAVLTAWLDDRLFATSDGKVVVVRQNDESLPTFDLIDPLTMKGAGAAPPSALTKIGTNNRLRRFLRTAVGHYGLSSPDPSVRLGAVRDMARTLDESTIEQLRAHAKTETDGTVRREIDTAMALATLEDGDVAVRLRAVSTLRDRLSADVRNRLAGRIEADSAGSVPETDAAVRTAITSALNRMDTMRSLYVGIEMLFFGLSLGSVLVLVAIGLAITFGVMGVINMAHGELMMLGAYTTYVVQTTFPAYTEWSVPLAIPAAFLVSGLVGVALERGIIRHLYGRPLETLLATFGVSLVLQQLVRSVFSANNRAVSTPSWMSGTLVVNEALAITFNRLYIVGFTIIVFGALLLVLKRTTIGLRIRAVAQNRGMARAMGVRSDWVDAATFGLGSGIAGVAGVALSQLTNVGPNLGQSYIIDSFMVVVFGGVGNIWGTLISGLSLGVVNKVLEPYAGAVLGKIFVLVGLILFIQRRPRGLFPQTGRAAEGT
jgi:urea transport system permease protein